MAARNYSLSIIKADNSKDIVPLTIPDTAGVYNVKALLKNGNILSIGQIVVDGDERTYRLHTTLNNGTIIDCGTITTPSVNENKDTILYCHKIGWTESSSQKPTFTTTNSGNSYAVMLEVLVGQNGCTVTYGGITKTLSYNQYAQNVYFGKFNGGTDDGTPSEGELVLSGDYKAFCPYKTAYSASKYTDWDCPPCIYEVRQWFGSQIDTGADTGDSVMTRAFINQIYLTIIPNSPIPTNSNITSMSMHSISGSERGMFKGCTGLTSVPNDLTKKLSNLTLRLSTGVASMYFLPFEDMFKGCTGLTNIPQIGGKPYWLYYKMTCQSSGYVFQGATNLPLANIPPLWGGNANYNMPTSSNAVQNIVPGDTIPISVTCQDNNATVYYKYANDLGKSYGIFSEEDLLKNWKPYTGVLSYEQLKSEGFFDNYKYIHLVAWSPTLGFTVVETVTNLSNGIRDGIKVITATITLSDTSNTVINNGETITLATTQTIANTIEYWFDNDTTIKTYSTPLTIADLSNNVTTIYARVNCGTYGYSDTTSKSITKGA